MASDTTEGHPRQGQGALHTFLIADLRGYTRFSDERGDEAASALARSFAAIVRDAVPPHGGEVLELRGDEALCVFGSARAALWTAVELQRRFRERVDGEPALPLGVGIGLDAGEAVPTEGGYRGRALNVASRLCSLARPGEILASETVTNLAGRQEKARYAPRRPTRVKGLEEPVRHVELVPEVELPPLPPPLQPPVPERRRVRRRLLLAAFGAALMLAIVLAVIALSSTGGDESTPPIAVARNSVAVIDPETNRVVADIPVGDSPMEIAVGEGNVWVLNRDALTISRIDARTRALVKTFAVAATPAGLAVGASAVWIGDSVARSVVKLDPSGKTIEVIETAPAGAAEPSEDAGPVAVSGQTVWFLSGEATLSRIAAGTGEVTARVSLPGLLGYSADLAVGEGAVWSSTWASAHAGVVTAVDPLTNEIEARIPTPGQGELAVGPGGLWGLFAGDFVWQLDRGTGSVVRAIAPGCPPNDLALGNGSLWVACGDGSLARIDPSSGKVVRRLQVGGILAGVAAGEGAVWVTVQ